MVSVVEKAFRLTSAINLYARVEDSNTQIGCVLIDPVLDIDRDKKWRGWGKSGGRENTKHFTHQFLSMMLTHLRIKIGCSAINQNW